MLLATRQAPWVHACRRVRAGHRCTAGPGGCVTGAPPDGPGAVATSPRTGTSTAAPSSEQPSTRTARPRSARPRVAVSFYRAADGTLVTLARFTGPVRYRLHCGSVDPGPAALPMVHAGPSIGHAEYRHLVAAFNGGFLLSAGAGGYEQEGHVISRLRPGLATLVIDRSGAARIGVWGAGLPQPHEAVYSIRQNLPPLVSQGQPSPAARNWGQWGATLGGGEYVARSALGQNRPASSSSPAACPPPRPTWPPPWCTSARVPPWNSTSTRNGCSWTSPGRRHRQLRAAIPGQVRPPDQFLAGLDPRLHHRAGRRGTPLDTEWPPRPGGWWRASGWPASGAGSTPPARWPPRPRPSRPPGRPARLPPRPAAGSVPARPSAQWH